MNSTQVNSSAKRSLKAIVTVNALIKTLINLFMFKVGFRPRETYFIKLITIEKMSNFVITYGITKILYEALIRMIIL